MLQKSSARAKPADCCVVHSRTESNIIDLCKAGSSYVCRIGSSVRAVFSASSYCIRLRYNWIHNKLEAAATDSSSTKTTYSISVKTTIVIPISFVLSSLFRCVCWLSLKSHLICCGLHGTFFWQRVTFTVHFLFSSLLFFFGFLLSTRSIVLLKTFLPFSFLFKRAVKAFFICCCLILLLLLHNNKVPEKELLLGENDCSLLT